MPTAAGARKPARASASRSRKSRRPANIRKRAAAIELAALAARPGGRLFHHACRKPKLRQVAAWPDLRGPVGSDEDRPVALVGAFGHPHRQILILLDIA